LHRTPQVRQAEKSGGVFGRKPAGWASTAWSMLEIFMLSTLNLAQHLTSYIVNNHRIEAGANLKPRL
jgi:hypothetical protein